MSLPHNIRNGPLSPKRVQQSWSRTIINNPKCRRIRLDNKCRIRITGVCGSHDRRDSDCWHLERQPQRQEPQNSTRPIFDFQSLGGLSVTNTDHCTKPHFSPHAGQSFSTIASGRMRDSTKSKLKPAQHDALKKLSAATDAPGAVLSALGGRRAVETTA